MKKWIWIAAFVWKGSLLGAWPLIQIGPEFSSLMITGEAGIINGNGSSPDSIQALPDAAFFASGNSNFMFGLTQDAHWLKMNLVNRDELRRQLLFEIANPNLQEVRVYQYWGTQQLQADSTGINYPYSRRALAHQNFIFPIDLPPGDSISLLVYLGPSLQPVNFNMYLWDKSYRLNKQAVRESFSLGSFFLLHAIFLLILVLTSWSFGIRELWYYSIYVLFGALFILADLGLGYRYIWSDSPYLQKVAPFLLVNLYTIFGAQFIRAFFHTGRRFPVFDKVFLAAIASVGVVFLSAFLLPWMPLGMAHSVSVIQYILFLLSSTAFIVLFLRTLRTRHQSGWFLLGFSIHGAGIVITILQYMKLLPNYSAASSLFEAGWPVTFSTQTTLMAGMVLEIPIVLYIAFRRFQYLDDQNQRQAERLSQLRQKSMNDLLLGIESERRRLAQDLHDGLSVNLAAIKMKANLMEVRSQGEQRKAWREIMDDLEGAYEELRRISHNLPPKSLYRIGLGGALEEIVQRSRTIRPEMEIQYFNNIPLAGLSKQTEMHIYRIVLELINNALKHSEASVLSIQLMSHDGQAVITAEDNGKGFEPEKTSGDGIGLQNIRSRAELLGGTLAIESRAGKGAVFMITLPLENH